LIDHPHLQRKSIRLRGYDYSLPGGYFVTINAYRKDSLFGDIQQEKLILNNYGEIVKSFWEKTPDYYQNVHLDTFIVMPNHIHGIIFIKDLEIESKNHTRAGHRPAPTKSHSLPEIVRAFKSFSANKINQLRNTKGLPVWQRNYYEHIIRNDKELNDIRAYIKNNIVNWHIDTGYFETGWE
jgi:putative transposase